LLHPTAITKNSPLTLHDALPISLNSCRPQMLDGGSSRAIIHRQFRCQHLSSQLISFAIVESITWTSRQNCRDMRSTLNVNRWLCYERIRSVESAVPSHQWIKPKYGQSQS